MTTLNFELAFQYVIENEGAYSNDENDAGGETFWGISMYAREAHRCAKHPRGLAASDFRGPGSKDLARHVYEFDYWRFDGIADPRLAIKLFDIVVNIGAGVKVIQRAAMVVPADGKYGRQTEAALLRLPVEEAIERLCAAMADHYVDLCKRDAKQLDFLKGWMRRAVRRPVTGISP